MKVVSSASTFLFKYVFPGVYVLAVVAVLYVVTLKDSEIGLVLLIPVLLAFAFLVLTVGQYKKVSIVGDHIVVSNYYKSVYIPASELSRFVGNRWISSRHVCLVFKHKTAFGSKILFTPKTNFNFFAPHPIVAELELLLNHDSRDPQQINATDV